MPTLIRLAEAERAARANSAAPVVHPAEWQKFLAQISRMPIREEVVWHSRDGMDWVVDAAGLYFRRRLAMEEAFERLNAAVKGGRS